MDELIHNLDLRSPGIKTWFLTWLAVAAEIHTYSPKALNVFHLLLHLHSAFLHPALPWEADDLLVTGFWLVLMSITHRSERERERGGWIQGIYYPTPLSLSLSLSVFCTSSPLYIKQSLFLSLSWLTMPSGVVNVLPCYSLLNTAHPVLLPYILLTSL